MKIRYYFLLLFCSIPIIKAQEFPAARWETEKIVLKHRNAQDLVQLCIGAESGVIVQACWDENAIILYGITDKLKSVLAFIKTQVDIPYVYSGGRFGDNILSK